MAKRRNSLRGAGFYDRPFAAKGLVSYRARGSCGYIMIGAKDDADALREAKRSTPNPTNLEVWDALRDKYVPVVPKRGRGGLKGLGGYRGVTGYLWQAENNYPCGSRSRQNVLRMAEKALLEYPAAHRTGLKREIKRVRDQCKGWRR